MQETNVTLEQSELVQLPLLFVSSLAELNNAIGTQANQLTANQTLTINLQPVNNILTLDGSILPINTAGTVTIQPSGESQVTVDGGGSYPGFVIMSGTVNLNSLTIQNMKSAGAPGSMGAGGGLLIANLSNGSKYSVPGGASSVTLENVNFLNCTAQGGAGNTSNAAGGAEGNGGGREGGGQGGTGGNTGASPSGNGLFGGPAFAGYFGVVGAGGDGGDSGGGGGAGSNTGDPFSSPGNGHPGGAGDAGDEGGNGGYGAAGGSGGGGGGAGGGGGGGEQFWGGYYGDGGNGGNGGNGGSAGAPGFGGGRGCSGSAGSGGQGRSHHCGGDGGAGASGAAAAGGGAGFGGAIFVMGNATLQFTGMSLGIAGGQAIGGTAASGGTNGSGAGAGIFLQGSGNLTLAPYGTLTISDPIVDEAGSGISPVPSGLGPDNLPYYGGHGVWGVSISGGGTIVLQGQQAFSGELSVGNNTTLDLSDCASLQANSVSFENNAVLIQQPAQAMPSPIQLNSVGLGYITDLSLNGYSSIAVGSLTGPSDGTTTIQLNLDQTGFTPGQAVTVLQSTQPLPALTVTVPSGFTQNTGGNTISVTMSKS